MDKIEKLYFTSDSFSDPDNGFAVFKAGYDARKPDPWDMVPEVPVRTGHCIRKLAFDPGRMHWQINEYYGTAIEDKIGHMVAAGYNCDVSRDGETRVYRGGEWTDA